MINVMVYFNKVKKSWKENEITTYASSLAFFLFLSFLPLLLFTCTLLPYLPVTPARLIGFLEELLPFGRRQWIPDLVAQVYRKAPGILSFSFLFSWWSLGKGMLALMRAFNRIYKREETRGYFRLRIMASIYTVVFLLVLLLSLCFGVFGKGFFQIIRDNVMGVERVIFLLEQVRMPVILGILLLFFLGLYALADQRKMPVLRLWPGALFTTLFWVLFSYVFSLYVKELRPFGGYGSLGTILLFLLWLYFCGCIILLGAILNKMIEQNE